MIDGGQWKTLFDDFDDTERGYEVEGKFAVDDDNDKNNKNDKNDKFVTRNSNWRYSNTNME